MNKSLSIIVPVYNTSQYLKKCLDSLSLQTLEDIEIIVIENGSTDNSPELCDEYSRNSMFRVYHTKNIGVSEARNKGIELATGKYIMFVDSDDWLEENACKSLYEAAEIENVDLVICAHFNESSVGSVERNMYKVKTLFIDNEEKCYTEEIQLHTLGLTGKHLKTPASLDRHTPVWARLYKREIIINNKIRFISLKQLPSECLQFNFEYTLYAKNAVYINIPLYHYRRNTGQSVTKPYREDLINKWKWWYELMLNNYLPILDTNHQNAFYSRIACSIIPLGGNALKLKSYKLIRNECKIFLKDEMLKKAFENFDYSNCAIHWRIFFDSAKYQKINLFIIISWAMRRILDIRKK